MPDESTESTTRIVVGPNDAVPAILSRLRSGRSAAATITIPASSSLFLTASEFRALKATAEQSRRILTIETDDRLRKQLAEMFGLPVVELTNEPRPIPDKTSVVNLETGHGVLESSDEQSPTADRAPRVRRRASARSSGGLSRSKLGAIAGAVVAVLVVIGLVASYLLQTATIEITAKRTTVATDVTFAVVQPGAQAPAGAAFTIQATQATLDVPFSASADTTGRARTSGATATGKVELRNTTASDVTIAAGTNFTSFDGVEYFFPNAVKVPALDPKTKTPGNATASISASAGGKNGNKDVGLLTGKLETGVYYSNRDNPIQGGSDSAPQGVAQADLDNLIAQANQKIPELAASMTTADGSSVVPGTVKPGQLTYSFDHKVGDQASELKIDAKMTVTALAYAASGFQTEAANAAQSVLAGKTPNGYELVPGSFSFGEPKPRNGQASTGLYTMTVKADARAVISDARAKEIVNAVAGKSPSDAVAFLETLPEVQSASVSSSPGFLPKRIPGEAGRITVTSK